MSDALLFLHLLSAAALVTASVAFTAIVLGARLELSAMRIFLALWHIGLVGLIIFGLALAIDIDGYEIWSAWILIAIVLWMAAGATGDRMPAAYRAAREAGGPLPSAVARIHWVSVVVVLLLLADMIWKPWA